MSDLTFFFFQAEDGIRDVAVTGVQTCALPICVCVCERERDGRERECVCVCVSVCVCFRTCMCVIASKLR